MTSKQLRVALEELEWELAFTAYPSRNLMKAVTAIRQTLAAPVQEPVGPEPFGYFQYDIRLDAWVQNRINNKGAAFYTAGDIRALKHRIHDQDAMLERQTARIVELQEHIENFDGEDR